MSISASQSVVKRKSKASKKDFVPETGEWGRVYEKFRDKDGKACLSHVLEDIRCQGIHPCQDSRFLSLFQSIKAQNGKCFPDAKIDFTTFESLANKHDLFGRALKKKLVVPDLEEFEKTLRLIFLAQFVDNSGAKSKNFREICGVRAKDPWSLSMFSVDGQKLQFGDNDDYFTMQSLSWPLLYGFILQNVGYDEFHKYCSYEPIPAGFIITDVNREGKPFNPLTLGGVLMCCAVWQSVAFPGLSYADKFEKFLCFLMEMSDGEKLNCNNIVVIDERENSFRAKAVVNELLHLDCFPPGTEPSKLLEYFYQINSIEVNSSKLALIGSTLANDGIHPFTGKDVLDQENNKNVLSILQICGIDHTTENFLFDVGIPATMSSSGGALFVVPGFFSIACYSPNLDSCDLSKRSLQFMKTLSNFYSFHPFEKSTWTRSLGGSKLINTTCGINCAVFNAATHGEIDAIARLITAGMNPGIRDYMKRTILHIAATNGHKALCKFIIANCPNIIEAKDIMGKTAYDDAVKFHHDEIASFLKNWAELRKGGDEEKMKSFLGSSIETK